MNSLNQPEFLTSYPHRHPCSPVSQNWGKLPNAANNSRPREAAIIVSMMDRAWRPLSVDDDESIAKYDALHEGVPRWMEKRFWDWVESSFFEKVEDEDGVLMDYRWESYLDRALLDDLEMALQIPVPEVPFGVDDEYATSLFMFSLKIGSRGLDIVDYLLSHGGHGDPEILKTLLEQGKSAWTVGERLSRPGLTRRVPEGVQIAADQVMETTGDAGIKLAQAWEALYGLRPDPTKAYSLAIKAVEDAAIPVVSPKNGQATLGTVVRDIRNQDDWNLPMVRSDDRAPSGEVLLGMMQMLWTGQHDRHGGNFELPPLTHEEAVVAVSLAVTLVHWFTTDRLLERAQNRS